MSHLQNAIPSCHWSMLIAVTCCVYAEEPQSFLLLHCSALLSYALTSCILVQVVESQLWVPAGLGAVPNLGLSQQSASACIKISCRSRGASLCPINLLTYEFMEIRRENWDAVNPILILFSHLNRVCIIWPIRMDFFLEEREVCVYVCACVCVCMWELCAVLFGFSSFTKITWRATLLWMERLLQPVRQHTVVTHSPLFLSVERWN